MNDDIQADENSMEGEVLARHRKEKKDLQGKIQQLKKSINKDKKKKKEICDEIAQLEKEQQEKHAKELEEIENDKAGGITNGVAAVNLEEKPDLGDCDEAEVNEVLASGQGRKLSKAAKRRQKKADANRAREAQIKEEVENNRFCARNVEAAKLKKLLKEKKLKMFEIKPDGDCMYAAIAHQMTGGTTVSALRTQASQYMRDNCDDFAPFITDPKTGETLTSEEFEEYCKQTENTPAWGGQPELRALSQVLKKRMEVLQAEGTPIILGEDYEDDSPLILAYYRHYYGLGEHYNSVVTITGNESEEEEGEET